MVVPYITCTCVELGCNGKQFDLGGVIHTGARMSRSAYRNHQKAIQKACAPVKQIPAVQNQVVVCNAMFALPDLLGPDNQPSFQTASWRLPDFQFMNQYALVVQLQATASSLLNGTSDQAVNLFLKLENEKMNLFLNPETHALERIPSTIATVIKRLHLEPQARHTVCCPKCFALYPKNQEYVRTIQIIVNPRFFQRARCMSSEFSKVHRTNVAPPFLQSQNRTSKESLSNHFLTTQW